MKTSLRLALSWALLFIGVGPVSAQNVSYNLYVKSGILSVRIGKGEYRTQMVSPSALPAAARTGAGGLQSGNIRFVQLNMDSGSGSSLLYELHDTIKSYQTPDGKGIFYRKATNENKRHDIETAVFSWPSGAGAKYVADLKAVQTDGKVLGTAKAEDTHEIYDLLSMITMLRSIDTSASARDFMAGRELQVPMVNGLMTVTQHIKYEGRRKVKADDGKTYSCIEISIHDYKYGERRETLRACVTDDSRHIPVQMDLVFSLGSIRCCLSSVVLETGLEPVQPIKAKGF